MSKNVQNGSLKEAQTIQNTFRGPQRGILLSLFFEATILYVFGHIPTNAYAILAAIVKQEFKKPKFKDPTVNFLVAATFIFRSGIAGTCPTCEVSNLEFLYLAYAFLFRYKSKNAPCQQVLKSRFSNIFVDNSMILITKRN